MEVQALVTKAKDFFGGKIPVNSKDRFGNRIKVEYEFKTIDKIFGIGQDNNIKYSVNGRVYNEKYKSIPFPLKDIIDYLELIKP